MAAVCLSLAILPAATVAAPAAGPVPNGSMETVVDGLPGNWVSDNADEAAVSRDVRFDGDSSLELRLHPGRNVRVRMMPAAMALAPNRFYRLALNVRMPPSQIEFSLGEIRAPQPEQWRRLGPWATDVVPPLRWARVEFPFMTGADASGGRLQIRARADPRAQAAQTVWIDAVSLLEEGSVVRLEPGGNRLENPGFENLDTQSGQPDAWRTWGRPTALVVVHRPEDVRSGDKALKVDLLEREHTILVNAGFDVRYPAFCRLTVWARGRGEIQFGLDRYTHTRIRIGPVWAGVGREGGHVPVAETWQVYRMELPLEHPEAARITPLISVYGQVWLDDAELQVVPCRIQNDQQGESP